MIVLANSEQRFDPIATFAWLRSKRRAQAFASLNLSEGDRA